MASTTENKPHPEKHEFRAEIKQLLDILIHSVYTSKDIFIRELISNAADALEKVRFHQVGGREIHSPDAPLEIRIDCQSDEEEKKLVIADTGIGMTDEEVRENIGTIAHSGATEFLQQLKAAQGDEQQELNLIGKFGVGFYSVFMAAEKVVLTTRSAQPDAKPVRWTCEGAGSYTLEHLDEDRPRGTQIEVYLKPDEARFAEADSVKEAIRRYSNFVPFPIHIGEEQVNQTRALWREPESQVTGEQYHEFYKLISHDTQDPMLHEHCSVDAPIQFSALLFVPPTNMEVMGFGEGEVSLQLYVRRVLIDGDNKQLLPKYLRFVRGVVESEDLPLNVSRETLQENRLVMKIRDQLTRRLLDRFLTLAKEDAEEYLKFWNNFGRIVKEGYNDFGNRDKFAELLRFNSSRHNDEEGRISLAEYVEAMPEEQKAIYYLSGPSREALLRDPRLELFRKHGVEVLYLTDMADEFVLANLGEYQEKPLVSADQAKPEDLKAAGGAEEADKEEEEKSEDEKASQQEQPDIQPLVARFKEILGDQVIDVRPSERLVDSPACLVGDESQPSGHMERVMRMMSKNTALPQRVLELNARHPLIGHLTRLVEQNENDPFVERACRQLFEGSMLLDGYLSDPHELVERMNAVLEDAAAMKRE